MALDIPFICIYLFLVYFTYISWRKLYKLCFCILFIPENKRLTTKYERNAARAANEAPQIYLMGKIWAVVHICVDILVFSFQPICHHIWGAPVRKTLRTNVASKRHAQNCRQASDSFSISPTRERSFKSPALNFFHIFYKRSPQSLLNVCFGSSPPCLDLECFHFIFSPICCQPNTRLSRGNIFSACIHCVLEISLIFSSPPFHFLVSMNNKFFLAFQNSRLEQDNLNRCFNYFTIDRRY